MSELEEKLSQIKKVNLVNNVLDFPEPLRSLTVFIFPSLFQ